MSKDMVITNVIGGLGNQMFQYAIGRALSLKLGMSLRLDVSGFSGYGLHQGYELHKVFNCSLSIATNEDVKNVLGWRSGIVVRKFLNRAGAGIFRGKHYVVEPHFHYWKNINSILQGCYLYGYWQSEKYFRDISSVIRKDFTFKSELQGRNLEIANKISQVNAVSLHVRRGDYVSNPNTNATHGLCALDYYNAAVQYVSGCVKQPLFFIFSDDIAWVKENLKIDAPCEYVDHNRGVESYNDMHLMSLCCHHIVANSSFSWWGAWLNGSKEKIVVAPKKWFSIKANTKDIMPVDWVAL